MGMSRLATCVEVMMVPFGLWMEIGVSATCLLVSGADTVKKWAVLLVSAMAVKVGGPTIADDEEAR